MLRNFR